MDTLPPSKTISISEAEWSARSQDWIDRLSSGELSAVSVTRNGHVVARLTDPLVTEALARFDAFLEAMRGTVIQADDYDPTAPTYEGPWNAELGIV